jgi:hypothetical protein
VCGWVCVCMLLCVCMLCVCVVVFVCGEYAYVCVGGGGLCVRKWL